MQGLTWPWPGMARPDRFYVGWPWAYFQAYVLSPVSNSRPNNEMGSAWTTPPIGSWDFEILRRGWLFEKKIPQIQGVFWNFCPNGYPNFLCLGCISRDIKICQMCKFLFIIVYITCIIYYACMCGKVGYSWVPCGFQILALAEPKPEQSQSKIHIQLGQAMTIMVWAWPNQICSHTRDSDES